MRSSVSAGSTILSIILILALEGVSLQVYTNPLANMTAMKMKMDAMNISTAMNETMLMNDSLPIFSEDNIKESQEPTPPPHKNSGTRSETLPNQESHPILTIGNSCIPQLLSPAEGAIMPNRDDYQTDNSGQIWLFDWNDVPGALKYHLYVRGSEADKFLIDVDVPGSAYCRDMSDGYIADQYRLNWMWGVKAYVNGQWCYSPTRHFDVEPMRIMDNPRDEAPMREFNESEEIRRGGEPFSPPNTEVSASVTMARAGSGAMMSMWMAAT